jgi:hypothetical protein
MVSVFGWPDPNTNIVVKVFERIICDQINVFRIDNKLLLTSQWSPKPSFHNHRFLRRLMTGHIIYTSAPKGNHFVFPRASFCVSREDVEGSIEIRRRRLTLWN